MKSAGRILIEKFGLTYSIAEYGKIYDFLVMASRSRLQIFFEEVAKFDCEDVVGLYTSVFVRPLRMCASHPGLYHFFQTMCYAIDLAGAYAQPICIMSVVLSSWSRPSCVLKFFSAGSSFCPGRTVFDVCSVG